MSRFILSCLALMTLALAATMPALAREPKTPPSPVRIGVYINDIQAIDLRNHAFSADIYIWLRNKDTELRPSSS